MMVAVVRRVILVSLLMAVALVAPAAALCCDLMEARPDAEARAQNQIGAVPCHHHARACIELGAIGAIALRGFDSTEVPDPVLDLARPAFLESTQHHGGSQSECRPGEALIEPGWTGARGPDLQTLLSTLLI